MCLVLAARGILETEVLSQKTAQPIHSHPQATPKSHEQSPVNLSFSLHRKLGFPTAMPTETIKLSDPSLIGREVAFILISI